MIGALLPLAVVTAISGPTCQSAVVGEVLHAGRPLARARVQAGERIARTDARGRFRLTGVCPGKVRLQAVRVDYAQRTLQVVVKGRLTRVRVSLRPIRVERGAEVVVQAPRLKAQDTRSVVSLQGDALQRTRGENLADALSRLPGVTVLRSGAVSKPIVRGQSGARVLKLFDGVRHEGQDWGMDHGPEIDPFAAGALRVVKGSAGVRYGPDALAGVILIEPHKLLAHPGMKLYVDAIGSLNDKRGTLALRLDGSPTALPALAWRVDSNYARGAGLRTPEYPLDNTGAEAWNAGATVAWRAQTWSAKLSYRRNNQRSGVCLCVRNETTSSFEAQLLRDKPQNYKLYRADYEIERPSQEVSHDIALARLQKRLPSLGEIEATYAFQRNLRREFDIVRVDTPLAQYNFTLRTHTANVVLKHKPRPLSPDTRLEGSAGVSTMLQDNVYSGWPLLSNYRDFSGGVFAIERWVSGDAEVEAGARFDHTTRNAYIPKNTYLALVREKRIAPGGCDQRTRNARCDSAFNAGTLSLGGLLRVSKRLKARVDLSSATRMPTIDEQYISGTAPSFPVMARGLGGLGPETSWSLTGTLDYANRWISGEVSAYGSYINDYIYLSPELREDGTVRTDVLIQGRFPRFSFNAINAVFYGVDLNATARVDKFELSVQGAMVRATEAGTGEGLFMIPADRLRTELSYRLAGTRSVKGPRLAVNGTFVRRQSNVSPTVDFAPVPDGYALLGASVSGNFELGKHRFRASLEAQNLLNTRYRDYTSMLRYYADEPGLQVFLRVGSELTL